MSKSEDSDPKLHTSVIATLNRAKRALVEIDINCEKDENFLTDSNSNSQELKTVLLLKQEIGKLTRYK